MLMAAPPIYRAWKAVTEPEDPTADPGSLRTVYLSPRGTVFNQNKAKELSGYARLVLICGHYEGVDERLIEEIVDEEISIGDYVLTGGELPALVLTDAIARMCGGVLPAAIAFEEESHFSGLLEYPQYTRPAVWEGMSVPEVLMSGHHMNIARWRKEESLRVTREKRPDMLSNVEKDD